MADKDWLQKELAAYAEAGATTAATTTASSARAATTAHSAQPLEGSQEVRKRVRGFSHPARIIARSFAYVAENLFRIALNGHFRF